MKTKIPQVKVDFLLLNFNDKKLINKEKLKSSLSHLILLFFFFAFNETDFPHTLNYAVNFHPNQIHFGQNP